MAELTLNVGLNGNTGAVSAPVSLNDREKIYENELFVQLCTSEDGFDGVWKWRLEVG